MMETEEDQCVNIWIDYNLCIYIYKYANKQTQILLKQERHKLMMMRLKVRSKFVVF